MESIKNFFVTPDSNLSTAGYVISILAAILIFGLAVFFSKKKRPGFSTRTLVVCAACLALGYVLSFIKFPLPFGGAVTLCSMLFIVLVGYWYGTGTGILVAFVYGILQFIQQPYIVSFLQVLCDYLLAFAALGLGGVFCEKKNGLIFGYLIAVIVRGGFHVLGGYLFWMEYMPEDFPQVIAWAYPIVYNYMYILAEAAATIIILCLPPVRKALGQMSLIAKGENFR